MKIIEAIQYKNEFLEAINRLLPQLSPKAAPLSKEDLKTIIDTNASMLFFAVDNNQFPGTLTLVLFATPTGKKARIEDFIVDQAARNRGIGKRLIDHAIAQAERLNVRSVELTSHPSRHAANTLYTKTEFQIRQTNVYSYKIK